MVVYGSTRVSRPTAPAGWAGPDGDGLAARRAILVPAQATAASSANSPMNTPPGALSRPGALSQW